MREPCPKVLFLPRKCIAHCRGTPTEEQTKGQAPRVVLVLGGGKDAGDVGGGTGSRGFGHPALLESWGPEVLG